jgi:hypothetical protein
MGNRQWAMVFLWGMGNGEWAMGFFWFLDQKTKFLHTFLLM